MSVSATPAAAPRTQRRLVLMRSLAVAALCLIAGAGGWLFTAIEPAAGDVRADVWKLPTWPGTDAGLADKAVAQRSIWGAAAAVPQAATAASAPLTPPDWRILATAVSGTERVVMIRIGTEAPQELRAGDELPGGAIIRGVEPDRLVIQLDGKRRILRIPPP